MFARLALIVAAALSLSLIFSSASAQSPAETATAKASVAESLQRMLKTYRGMQRYQDIMRVSTEMVIEEPKGEPSPASQVHETTLRFERPNRLAISVGGMSMVCDGDSLWTIRDDLGQCLKDPAPAALNLDSLPQQLTRDLRSSHPVLLMLLSASDDVRGTFPEVTSYAGRTEVNLDGEICDRVDCVFSPAYFYRSSGTMSLFISRDSSLLRQAEFDLTQAYNDMAKNRPLDADSSEPVKVYSKVVTTIKFDDVSVNQPIEHSEFTFKPDDSVRLVDQFDWNDSKSRRAQRQLIGKSSPQWEATNLEGHEVTLASLQGKVVLLDFWATWCGPCVAALPHVQTLADRFKDKPVMILGVNLDEGGPVDKVRNFLARKSINLPQVLGKDPEIDRLYNVQGIPHMVLIDQQGIVQDFRTGFDPSAEEAIAEQIEQLLAGKPIVRHAEEGTERLAGPVGQGILDELKADALKPGARHRVDMANAQMVMDVDIDGDGRTDLACTDYQGGINLISNDGQTVRRLKLKGLPRESQISSLALAKLGGRLHWLAVSQSYSQRTGPTPSELIMFDDQGELRWSYKPELPEGIKCDMIVATGDLDGNGDDDPIVGLTAFKARVYPNGAYSKENEQGYLVVLDSAGQSQVRRRLASPVEFIRVTPASQSHAGGIFCIGRGQMEQLEWVPPGE